MRAVTPLILLGSLILTLACGGAGDTTAEEPVVALVEAPTVWEVTRQDGQALVKAGAGQGLAVDTQMVLLGPPLAGTDNRQIVGSAKVAEIWPDLARITPDRIKRDAPEPAAARVYTAEDQAALDAIPLVGGGKGARAATSAASLSEPAATTGEFTVDQVPAALKSGTSESRMDALVRYETDASMTDAIVWVLKNDSDSAVQFKAWRVVRARWKRGTGNAADHEAAAAWVATHGGDDARLEALGAIGERSRSLTVPAKHLADPLQSVRIAAANAVFDIGSRTGKRAEAKKLLVDRRDVESAGPVRKRLADWIEEL
ncbi:MAG: hypothetical protein Q8P18_10360 [Pseudomonadota bacterium]|nr:hypothetical protein [Pseudomonadota bacterium]